MSRDLTVAIAGVKSPVQDEHIGNFREILEGMADAGCLLDDSRSQLSIQTARRKSLKAETMHTRSSHPELVLFVFVLAAWFSLACSDDSGGDDGGDQIIYLGTLVEQEDTGDTQKEVSVALLALKTVNDGGGIRIGDKDYQLELLVEDHGGEPSIAVEAMARLSQQGATALIGPPWSSLTLGRESDHRDGVALSARAHDMLLVSPSATSSAITDLADDDLMWRTAPSDAVQGAVAADAVYGQGITTAAIIHRDEPWGQGLATAFTAAYEARGGQVVAAVAYDVDKVDIPDVKTHDYDAELAEVFAQQPGVVLLVTFDEVFQITNRIALGGYLDAYATPPLFFGSDGNFTADLLVNGSPEVLRHMWGTTPFTDTSRSAHQKFAALATEVGADLSDDTAALRYDAGFLIALAMQSAGSWQADDVKLHLQAVSRNDPGDVVIEPGEWAKARAALLNGEGVNYEGASGAIEFSDQGDPTVGSYTVWKVVEPTSGTFDYDLSELIEFDAAGQ